MITIGIWGDPRPTASIRKTSCGLTAARYAVPGGGGGGTGPSIVCTDMWEGAVEGSGEWYWDQASSFLLAMKRSRLVHIDWLCIMGGERYHFAGACII